MTLPSSQTPLTLVTCPSNSRTFILFQYSQPLPAFRVLDSSLRIQDFYPAGFHDLRSIHIFSWLCFLHGETTSMRLCSLSVSHRGDGHTCCQSPCDANWSLGHVHQAALLQSHNSSLCNWISGLETLWDSVRILFLIKPHQPTSHFSLHWHFLSEWIYNMIVKCWFSISSFLQHLFNGILYGRGFSCHLSIHPVSQTSTWVWTCGFPFYSMGYFPLITSWLQFPRFG